MKVHVIEFCFKKLHFERFFFHNFLKTKIFTWIATRVRKIVYKFLILPLNILVKLNMMPVMPQAWEDSMYILSDCYPEIIPALKSVIVCALPFISIILSNPPVFSMRWVLYTVTEAQENLATLPRLCSPWLTNCWFMEKSPRWCVTYNLCGMKCAH